jgi:hypothetical protein
MAQLTFPVTRAGLEVPVWLGVSHRESNRLLASGQPIPPPVQARGLVDTGSDTTAVAPWVLHQLGLPKATSARSQTASGLVPVSLYEASLSITDPGGASPMLTAPQLLVMELTTALADADVLVGLDVLLQCRLLLDGPARQFTLDF